MTVQLPVDIYSPDHIGIALWELGGLIDKLGNAAARAAVAPGVAAEDVQSSSFLLGILRNSQVSSTDRAALEQFQAELRALRDKAPVAHIVLAAPPTRTLKREMVIWFRSAIHADHLATFAVRSDIGGGFILRVGSKQYDFTFRTQLREDRHRLTEIFDSVRQ